MTEPAANPTLDAGNNLVMRSRLLAVAGMAARVLSIAATAQNLEGASLVPIPLVIASGTIELAFVVLATVVLWRKARKSALVLASSEFVLLSFGAVFLGVTPQYGTAVVIPWNLTKVVNFVAFVWVIVKLFRSDPSPSRAV